MKRKGGGALADRQLALWCIVLTIFLLIFVNKVRKVKANYTELHRKVSTLESYHD